MRGKLKLRRRTRWILGIALAALLVIGVTGCQSIVFYKQAIQGQTQILWNQKPIEKVLADPATPVSVKEKLGLVLELRKFADRELHLPPDGHYLKYADLHRRFVVWNMHAAPELSLEPKTWWYPFVGRLKYRGYFAEKQARKYAAKLQKESYDVFVGGVEAYSTLGWFRDPVLNTFLQHSDPDVAEILFHELSHQKVFAKADTDFNEAFATAVAEEGVKRWLTAIGNTNALREYLIEEDRNEQFVHLVNETRGQLKKVYGDPEEEASAKGSTQPSASDAWKREQKQKIIEQLKARYAQLKVEWRGYSEYDRWFARPINNAQLNTISTYYDLVPYFRRLLQRDNGNLDHFYSAVEKLAEMRDKEQRHNALRTMAGES